MSIRVIRGRCFIARSMRHSAANEISWEAACRTVESVQPVGGLLKRGVDVVFATLALVLLTPLLVVTGVLIAVLIGNPIMVAEKSVGWRGKVFAALRYPYGSQ